MLNPRFFFNAALLAGAFLVLLTASFLYWAHLPSFKEHQAFEGGKCLEQTTPPTLNILSYNIAYGRGVKDDKGDLRTKDEIVANLTEISRLIQEADIDIALFQEVDLASHRTQMINEAEYLARSSGLSCFACVTTWQKNYLPFPYWPPAQHYGRMKSGQCILSRFPFLTNERLALPAFTAKNFLYRAFYLNRAVQKSTIAAGDKDITIFNAHLEAYDMANREAQAAVFAKAINTEISERIVAGGDFNALPPFATQKKGFPDNEDETWRDVSNDTTLEIFMTALPQLQEALTKATPEAKTFTFPADNPSRRIDYIFYSAGLKRLDGKIITPQPLSSDHLPVFAKLKFMD